MYSIQFELITSTFSCNQSWGTHGPFLYCTLYSVQYYFTCTVRYCTAVNLSSSCTVTVQYSTYCTVDSIEQLLLARCGDMTTCHKLARQKWHCVSEHWTLWRRSTVCIQCCISARLFLVVQHPSRIYFNNIFILMHASIFKYCILIVHCRVLASVNM